MKNILVVTYSLIAALIGAGFASGQEIICYFAIWGKHGICGIFTSVVFFTVFIYVVLSSSLACGFKTYDDFLCQFKSLHTRKFAKSVTLIFAVAVYSAMLSAIAEILKEIFGIPLPIGGLISAAVAVFVLSSGTERIFTLNGVIGIVLVFMMIFSCLYILNYREYHAFSLKTVAVINDGLIYSGYNLIAMVPVIISLSRRLKNKTSVILVSLTTGILMAVIMLLVFCLLSIYCNKIDLGSLPMLTIAKRQNNTFAIIYTVVLFFAITTTLLSSGGALIDALKLKDKPIYIAVLSMFAYMLSGIGFANLINTAYKICGVLGLFVCIMTVFVCIKHRKNVHLQKKEKI